jgi:pentatricopeptide repeat protein
LRSPARRATLRSFAAAANAAQWNAAVRHRLDSGLPAEAVSAFAAMLRAGARPDAFTLPLLNRAAALLPGRGLAVGAAHSVGLRAGIGGDPYFCNTLLQAYARRGAVARARQLFDEMRSRDVVSWTSLVSAYAGAWDAQAVSLLVSTMRADGCEPSAATLAVLLRACMAERDAAAGGQLHCYAVKSGWSGDVVVLNSILTHLSRITGVDVAVRLFEQSPRSDVVSWNIIISEYSSEGRVSKVVDMYERMRREEVCPSCETLTSVVAAFAKCRHLRQGQKLHSFALKSGLIDTILVASFVDFYAKCGELPSSVQLFEEFRGKSYCIWSAMLAAFIHHGHFLDAIHLFGRMMDSSLVPSADVLRALVICYTELGDLRLGKVVHGYIIRNDYAAESQSCALETSIVKLYARCGNIHLAERCFSSILHKDIVSWSSMIETYTIHGDGRKAVALFRQMLEEGARPNGVTFLSLLSACGHSGLVSEARELFDCMTRKFGIAPELGHYTCMVDVLGRSGNLEEAVQVISGMTVKPDGRIWGALLASCKTHSNSKLANLAAQKLMELEPNNVGYYVVFSNVQAGGSRWGEVEDIRSSMVDKDMQKSPAWSCVSDIGGV